MSLVKALSVFLGTVIGVGIFGLPYVASKAGFSVSVFYLALMAFVVFWVNSLYGRIILETDKICRFPGYVEEYLGQKWKRIILVLSVIGLLGSLLAYLIIGGEFMNSLFSLYFGGNPATYTMVFFIAGAYLIFRGIKSISRISIVLMAALAAILVIFLLKTAPLINLEHLLSFNIGYLALPYGVILFSFWGADIMPEIKEMLFSFKAKDIKKVFQKTQLYGVIITTIIYFLFIFMVLGVSGSNTSKEAFIGLESFLGLNILRLAFVFGIISCFTSYIAIGLTLKKILWYDLGLPRIISWISACFIPLILFFLGLKEFIGIIGFTGAVIIGIEGVVIVFLYKEFLRKKYGQKINPTFYSFAGIFAIGAIFEIVYFFIKI